MVSLLPESLLARKNTPLLIASNDVQDIKLFKCCSMN